MTSSVAPTRPFLTISIPEEPKIAHTREQSKSQLMSIEIMQALCTAMGGTGAALLALGIDMASKLLADANHEEDADWMHKGTALWVGVSVAFWCATAYFCILDQRIKRPNNVNPESTSLPQPIAIANEKLDSPINSNDLA